MIEKKLGYKVVRDTSCGIKLVLIVDSTVPKFVKKLSSKVNRKSKRVIVVIILGSTLWFSNVQPAPAMGLSIPPPPVVRVEPNYKHTYEMKVAPTVSPKIK